MPHTACSIQNMPPANPRTLSSRSIHFACDVSHARATEALGTGRSQAAGPVWLETLLLIACSEPYLSPHRRRCGVRRFRVYSFAGGAHCGPVGLSRDVCCDGRVRRFPSQRHKRLRCSASARPNTKRRKQPPRPTCARCAAARSAEALYPLLIALGTLVAGSVNWRQAAADLGVTHSPILPQPIASRGCSPRAPPRVQHAMPLAGVRRSCPPARAAGRSQVGVRASAMGTACSDGAVCEAALQLADLLR